MVISFGGKKSASLAGALAGQSSLTGVYSKQAQAALAQQTSLMRHHLETHREHLCQAELNGILARHGTDLVIKSLPEDLIEKAYAERCSPLIKALKE